MKRVVRCLGCSNIVRLYGSFSVTLDERVVTTLTGEVKNFEIKGKICRDCATKAGYKDRRKEKDGQ